jgi:hypothetical protein
MFVCTLLFTLFFGTSCHASQPLITLDRAAQTDDERDERWDEQSNPQNKRPRITDLQDDAPSEGTPTEVAPEEEVEQEEEEEEWYDPRSMDLSTLISYMQALIDEENFFYHKRNAIVDDYKPHVRELYKRIHKTRIETKGDFCEAQNLLFNIIGKKDPLFIHKLQCNQ